MRLFSKNTIVLKDTTLHDQLIHHWSASSNEHHFQFYFPFPYCAFLPSFWCQKFQIQQQPQDQNKKCNEKKITLVIKPDIKSKETSRQILWQDFIGREFVKYLSINVYRIIFSFFPCHPQKNQKWWLIENRNSYTNDNRKKNQQQFFFFKGSINKTHRKMLD